MEVVLGSRLATTILIMELSHLCAAFANWKPNSKKQVGLVQKTLHFEWPYNVFFQSIIFQNLYQPFVTILTILLLWSEDFSKLIISPPFLVFSHLAQFVFRASKFCRTKSTVRKLRIEIRIITCALI